ncbi:zinc finger protein PLAG1-like [Anneissia japonica]|uniref:zinc finger protein PLAG1-like n=1 Tax=Anneissia japonica TaxID=1529436 RepID=UPI001425674F|nr:zinc finger protein PLAG1-like [Anneissia japonica]
MRGERSYRCEECSSRFEDSRSLGRHRDRTHASREDFKCRYCPGRFSNLDARRRHYDRFHRRGRSVGRRSVEPPVPKVKIPVPKLEVPLPKVEIPVPEVVVPAPKMVEPAGDVLSLTPGSAFSPVQEEIPSKEMPPAILPKGKPSNLLRLLGANMSSDSETASEGVPGSPPRFQTKRTLVDLEALLQGRVKTVKEIVCETEYRHGKKVREVVTTREYTVL